MIQTPRDRDSYSIDLERKVMKDINPHHPSHPRVQYITNKMLEITSDLLAVPPHEVMINSHFQNDLGADSLDLVELVMYVEREFNIAIPDEVAERLTTVQEALAYLVNETNVGAAVPEKEVVVMEAQPRFEPILFEIDKEHRILTHVRRFRLGITPDLPEHHGFKGEEGDIFEECYDSPNSFVNITRLEKGGQNSGFHFDSLNSFLCAKIAPKHKPESWQQFIDPVGAYDSERAKEDAENRIKNWNSQIDMKLNYRNAIMSLEQIESIPVLESKLLDNKRMKKLATAYKRKLKALAKLNEDMTAMKHILQITDED